MIETERQIDRIRFWQGQLLRSRDFRAMEAAGEQYRWWHNRSLHEDAYGVALGLDVHDDAGVLRIGCGVAYDCFGRELLLATPVRVPMPTPDPPEAGVAPEPRVLILRLREMGEPNPSDPVSCDPCAIASQWVELVWLRESRFDPRSSVALAWVDFDAAGHALPDLTYRPPSSRPIARPHMGSGMTTPGGTAWEVWTEEILGLNPLPIGLQTRVDTSAAGFAVDPVYAAELHMPQRLPGDVVFPTPLCHIHDPGPSGFTFRVWLPRIDFGRFALGALSARVGDVSGSRVAIADPRVFSVGDPVSKPGARGFSTVTKVRKDFIEIEPAIRSLKTDDTLRVSHIGSLEQLQRLVAGRQLRPGMALLVEGPDLETGRPLQVPLTVAGGGPRLLNLAAAPIPKIAFGRAAAPTRISLVSAPATTDLALMADDLKWHVCWLGMVCEPPRTPVCPERVCDVASREVC